MYTKKQSRKSKKTSHLKKKKGNLPDLDLKISKLQNIKFEVILMEKRKKDSEVLKETI